MFISIAGKGIVNLDKIISISANETEINFYYTDGYTGTITFGTIEEVDKQVEEILDYLQSIGELK